MTFMLMVIILIWFVAWPLLSFAYMKHTYGTPQTTRQLTAREVVIGPRIIDDNPLVMLKVGEQTMYFEEDDVFEVAKRLDKVRMTVATMKEVQALG